MLYFYKNDELYVATINDSLIIKIITSLSFLFYLLHV